jgi:hypothetical protein
MQPRPHVLRFTNVDPKGAEKSVNPGTFRRVKYDRIAVPLKLSEKVLREGYAG